MPILYHMDFEAKIVYERWTGEVSVDDIIAVLEKEMPQQQMPDGIRAMFVLEATPNFTIKDVGRLIPVLLRYKPNLRRAMWGFVATTPETVAYLYYFQKLSLLLPFIMKIFASEEACIDWLGIGNYEIPKGLQISCSQTL